MPVFSGGIAKLIIIRLLRIMRIVILLSCISLLGSAQNGFQHVWSSALNNTSLQGGNSIGHSIKNDISGNTYVLGSFYNTVDMDPGPGQYNLFSLGDGDVFIAKYSPSGSLMWAKSMGSTNFETGYALALDAAGNIYLTGTFTGTMRVAPPLWKSHPY